MYSPVCDFASALVRVTNVEHSSLIIHGAEIYRQAALSSVDVNSASRKAEKTYVNYSPEISKISGLFSAMGVWKKQREIDSRLFGSMIRTK